MKKKEPLISVKEALSLVLKETIDFGVEEVDFKNSMGRVLRENITADREMPPFDRVSMDGIAIKSSVFNSGKRNFKIENIQAAGSEPGRRHPLAAAGGASHPGAGGKVGLTRASGRAVTSAGPPGRGRGAR